MGLEDDFPLQRGDFQVPYWFSNPKIIDWHALNDDDDDDDDEDEIHQHQGSWIGIYIKPYPP